MTTIAEVWNVGGMKRIRNREPALWVLREGRNLGAGERLCDRKHAS